MPINRTLGQMQASATRLIKAWGGTGKLIRDGVSRPCFVAMGSYNPTERALISPMAVRLLIAAPLTIRPDHKLDQVEFPAGTFYRIVKPVKGLAPDGVTWIKYDCECEDGDAI